jgi:protein tyrosine kinase modulator
MNPLLDQIWDEVRSSWRFRWIALATATAVAIVGWVIVFALPNRYEAAASVFVDTRTPLRPLTAEQNVDAELNFVRQSLLAGPKLQRIAREAGVLPPYSIDPQTQEGILAGLRGRIEIDVSSASGREEERNAAGTIYRIVFRDPNRDRALHLVTTLLDTFVKETLRGKREGSEKAQQVLEAQINDCEVRLRTAEAGLAAFKSKHPMPTEPGGYFAQLQREQDKVSELKTRLKKAQARQAILTRQLRDDAAAAATPPPGGTGATAATDTLSQINAVQAQLDDLLVRFTDKHPDVIAARRKLAELKQRLAAEIEGLKKGDAAAAPPSGASSNPLYQDVQRELHRVELDISDLNAELAEHQSKIAELTPFVDTAPQVETELMRLNRDYDAIKAEHTKLLEELQKERLGERADTAGSILFEVIEPPTASLRPVWPKRPLLLVESLLAALAAGGALAYGLHYLRPVVTMTSALAQAAGAPVLGVVSVAFPERARHALRADVLRFSLAGGCLVVAFIAVLMLSLQGYHLSVTALKQMLHS